MYFKNAWIFVWIIILVKGERAFPPGHNLERPLSMSNRTQQHLDWEE